MEQQQKKHVLGKAIPRPRQINKACCEARIIGYSRQFVKHLFAAAGRQFASPAKSTRNVFGESLGMSLLASRSERARCLKGAFETLRFVTQSSTWCRPAPNWLLAPISPMQIGVGRLAIASLLPIFLLVACRQITHRLTPIPPAPQPECRERIRRDRPWRLSWLRARVLE